MSVLLFYCGLAAAPLVPGPQPDGSMLLHNQWPIRPVGRQIPLGEWPVAIAADPAGRFAAVLQAGYGRHHLSLIDLQSGRVVSDATIHDAFGGLAFSPDGTLVCGGGGDGVLHRFAIRDGTLAPAGDLRVETPNEDGEVGGLALGPGGRVAYATILFNSHVAAVDVQSGRLLWSAPLDPPGTFPGRPRSSTLGAFAPNDATFATHLITESEPFGIAVDARRHRVYASLWGRAEVAVLDAGTGRPIARWASGLHPNQLVLSRDGRRLFVSNGGVNTVSAIDTATGRTLETLCSAFSSSDRPGSTPDSLALGRDGRTLYVANADNDNVAVFDVSKPGRGEPLGYIPAGWTPTAVQVTPDGRRLLIVSERGLRARTDVPGTKVGRDQQTRTVVAARPGPRATFPYIATLYPGSLAVVDLPRGDRFIAALNRWTAIAQLCRPAVPAAPAQPGPIPGTAREAARSPIRYVVYIIKENRTYDEVFGDIAEANGDPSLCLFPAATTPNLHRIARQFVVLDNFYANAEVSPSGHEWSTAAYCSEFVERTWPINASHKFDMVPYPGEGGYMAAVPAAGYLWDRAAQAGVSYFDFGEMTHVTAHADAAANLPALQGHLDPGYRGWDLHYSDLDRAARYIADLHGFEAAGAMPRLQILRLPNDHTFGATAGALTPQSMVAQNDLAAGRIVEALSHSRFWPQMAIFIVEDDAQNGPDHVDAHRTEALVISPYVRRHFVDSTPYTTCSMLATMELILGLQPMSQFDALATPMRASFQAAADLSPYTAVPNEVSLDERNPAGTRRAAMSATFDFSREDAIDEQAFNQVIWESVRGEGSVVPAPVHAAFVHGIPQRDDDDD